jgi:5-methyltetrahydropteroyltriglutamate--homocysteine methyltransferase
MSTQADYGMLFPTSVVGSMPRSDFVRELVALEASPSPRQAQALDAAVTYVVGLQEEAGLDVVTDGEWRRASYIGVIAELAHGFEVGVNPANGRPWTIVVDKLEPKEGGFIVREARFLKRVASRKIKVTLPAPALLGERMWDPERSASAYPKRRDFVEACVPILRREAELLAAEGVDVIQIDDPHLCLLVDPEVRAGYEGVDAEEPGGADSEADFAVETDNAVVEGIKNTKLAVHLCRRAGARVRGDVCYSGDFSPIIDQLNRLAVHHLTMEFTSPGAGEVEVFRRLRADLEIGLGCVSVHPGQVDTPEVIAARVEQAMEAIDKERIVLNPDCGFAPGSAARVDIDEVYTKIKNLAEAGRLLRQRHG